ncbi:MAG TPA: hypothetical protein VF604_16705 [Pyrinomonadaceae bacterium]|jgi:DNA repair exonuclease SbcCD ATPase subunit
MAAQEEEAIRGKEQGSETGGLSDASAHASLLPPKLNLKRLESIQRLLQYGAVLTLLVFVVLIIGSYFQLRGTIRKIAENERKIAEDERKLADSNQQLTQQTETLVKQRDELEKSEKMLAEQKFELEKLDEEIKEKQKLIASFQEAARSVAEKNPGQGEQLKQAFENKISQNFSGRQIPPRIYIQIAGEDQRARATDIARQLQNKGYLMPGIENVRNKSPKVSELRACSSDDVARTDVGAITDALESLSVTLGEPKFLTNCGKARPRHYELWFGQNF